MKTASRNAEVSALPTERRSSVRRPADGEVVLRLLTPPVEIRGSLLDTSASGFRAAHGSPLLETGQTVEFSHSGVRGTARVVWNRVCDGRWQSGFFILD